MQRPDNHGKLWTNEETTQLMKEIKIIDINQIAIIHKRTENAIFLKLIREAARLSMNDNQLTLYDLSIITSLKISKILQGFKKINYIKFDIHDVDDNFNDSDDNDDEEDENHYYYDNKNNSKYLLLIPGIIIIGVMLYWRD